MKYMSGLPAKWIHAYVRQLRKRHAIPIDVLLEHLQVAFSGAIQPAGLSRLQQQDLIAWLCHPDRRSPSDRSEEFWPPEIPSSLPAYFASFIPYDALLPYDTGNLEAKTDQREHLKSDAGSTIENATR